MKKQNKRWVLMWYKVFRLTLILSLALELLPTSSSIASIVTSPLATKEKTLITYADHLLYQDAIMIRNLVDHFDVAHDLLILNDLSDDQLVEYDHIIFIDSMKRKNKEKRETEKRFNSLESHILWLGYGDFEKSMSGISMYYKEKVYATESFQVARINDDLVEEKSDVIKVATASNGWEERPLLFREGNRWYFTASQYTGSVNLIIADVLHDVIGQAHSYENRGLFRIEDVHPLIESDRLMKIADLMMENEMPFVISVIPLFIDPDNGRLHTPLDNPAWVEALRYMVTAGGTIVLDGLSHEGLESEGIIEEQLKREIAVLAKVGLYPIAFGPMYETISEQNYEIASRYFSTLVGKIQGYDESFQFVQEVPYELIKDRYGFRVYPQTAGYLSNNPADIEKVMHKVEWLMMVRDSFIGVQHYPSISLERLEELLQRIKNEPIQWIDLRNERHQVQSDFMGISVPGNGLLEVQMKDELILERLITFPRQESLLARSSTYYAVWGLAILVGVFVFLFILFLLVMRIRRKYRLFSDKEDDQQ